MHRTLLFFIAVWLLAASAWADEARFINGHNLTITSDLIAPGHVVLGSDICGVGVTDTLAIGTSTWLWKDYNMASIAVRKQFAQTEDGGRWAFQSAYFKTFETRGPENFVYEMQSLWNMLIRTYAPAPRYRLHLNLHANYYWNEKMPFSLRRPSMDKSPWQLNVSALHEMNIVDDWFIFGEMGLVDFAKESVHIHVGASIGQVKKYISWHFGLSVTGTPVALFSPVERRDYQQTLREYSAEGYNEANDESRIRNDYAIHPEFPLQLSL